MTGPALRPLLTAEEVGTVLRVRPRAVLGWARAGLIPWVRVGERGVRFRAEDVAAWVAERTVPAAPAAPDRRAPGLTAPRNPSLDAASGTRAHEMPSAPIALPGALWPERRGRGRGNRT